MSVVTKHSSILVAILAITYLTAFLPAQCEKPSTLKPDSVHRQCYIRAQVLLGPYRSDEMWVRSRCAIDEAARVLRCLVFGEPPR